MILHAAARNRLSCTDIPPGRNRLPKRNEMTEGDLAKFKSMLLELRDRLNGDVSMMEREALSGADGSSSHPTHMADLGTDAYEQEFTLNLMAEEGRFERSRLLFNKEIVSWDIGSCLECGGQHPKARLEMIAGSSLLCQMHSKIGNSSPSREMARISRSTMAVFAALSIGGCAADLWTVSSWHGSPGDQEPWWLVRNYVGIETAVNEGALFGMGAGYGRYFRDPLRLGRRRNCRMVVWIWGGQIEVAHRRFGMRYGWNWRQSLRPTRYLVPTDNARKLEIRCSRLDSLPLRTIYLAQF